MYTRHAVEMRIQQVLAKGPENVDFTALSKQSGAPAAASQGTPLLLAQLKQAHAASAPSRGAAACPRAGGTLPVMAPPLSAASVDARAGLGHLAVRLASRGRTQLGNQGPTLRRVDRTTQEVRVQGVIDRSARMSTPPQLVQRACTLLGK